MRGIIRKIADDFNIKKQAKDLGIPIWQAPSFLFALMGIITVVIMMAVFFASQRYDDPEILIISEVFVVIMMLTISSHIIQSINQMAEVNRVKSEFISIASHQLKTPLSEINWEIELLLSKHKEGMREKQLELIKRIKASNNCMARLVNDLLDVVRIEQGGLMLSREKVDLVELIKKVIDNNSLLARANNVEIRFNEPKNGAVAVVDRRRIGVVLDNLISNSIKYVGEKGIVKVGVSRRNEKFLICVKDNGIGIPKNQQNCVFRKFFRGSNVSEFQVSGTGLGLYISKNIIDQSGGEMWFESEENKGTNFYFTLPANSSDLNNN